MGKISDIWVRLGLKKEGFDKGMNDAAKKTEQTGGKMSKMLTAAKAGWAAVGAAVIAFSREMVQATNKVGDAWARTMGGVKNGWQMLLANLSNTSWKDLFKGLTAMGSGNVIGAANFFKKIFGGTAEAAEAGRDMAAAFDAEFELTRSLRIQREKIKGELADLRVMMANVNLSSTERRAAVEKYKALLEPLYKAEIETRREMLDAAVKAWLAGTGVSASVAQVREFFTYIGTDAEKMAKIYPELARVYNDLKGDKANDVLFTAIANLTAAENGLANELKEVNTTLNGIKDLSIVPDLSADADLDIDLTDIGEIEPMDWDTILGDYDAPLDAIVDKWKQTQEEIALYTQMIGNAVAASMSNGLQAITDMMMGLEGADMKNVLAAFIAPLGDTMKQMGSMIVAEGVAMLAFKNSFKAPEAAIAAGLALIAIGSAVSSGLQRLTANPGGGTGYSSGSSASAGVQNYESEMTIYVEGRISGNDIVLSGNKTLNKWRR
jgi:hypothetical protein